MKHLGLSGGGAAIAGIYGSAETIIIDKGFEPDIISGISAGSILSVALAMKKFDKIKPIITNFTLHDFFDKKNTPVNNKGKLTFKAIWNAISGKPYLGKQTQLLKTISKIITPEDYAEYQKGDYAQCWVGSVDFRTGSRFYANLKDNNLTYQDYLTLVAASSNIPVYTEPIKYKDKILYDGGVRDHISTPWILENIDGITESVSVYSRPDDYQLKNKNWYPKDLFSVLTRYVAITNIEISKSDESKEDELCRLKNIKQHKIFLPKLLNNFYDTDPQRLKLLYDTGKKVAYDNF